MRSDDTRRQRKIEKGLELLGDLDEDPRLATQAFRAADWSTGLALAAIMERKYERAVNKALEALGRAHDDPLEEKGAALLALRKARQHLPTPDARPDQAAREERLMARTDACLEKLGGEDWAEAEKQVKARCEAFPHLYGPLLTAETGASERRRLVLAAFQVLMETGDTHQAAELVQEGEVHGGSDRALLAAALCRHCLPITLSPNPQDPGGDPWWIARKVQERAMEEATGWRPESGTTREETFLEAVACLNLSRFLQDRERAESPGRALEGAEARFASLSGLPPLAGAGVASAPTFVQDAARLYFEGIIRLERHDLSGCAERLRVAAAMKTSHWSDRARSKLPNIEEGLLQEEELTRAWELLDKIYAARERGDRQDELAFMETLAKLEPPPAKEEVRMNFLRVVTRAAVEPSAIIRAVKGHPSDPELQTIGREHARRLVSEGRPEEALTLLRALEPLDSWSESDLVLYASLAEKAGWLSTCGRIFSVLAERDCGRAPIAVRHLLQAGRRAKARAVLAHELDRGCRDTGHRWETWQVARVLADPELEEQAGQLFLEHAGTDPRVGEVRLRVASLQEDRQRSQTEVASQAAGAAAARRDWPGVDHVLAGTEAASLRPEVIEVWARAKAARGLWREAAELHRARGEEPEALWDAAQCLLRAGAQAEAAGALERLAASPSVMDEMDRWRDRARGDPSPDLGALALLALGDARGAAERALDPGVLRQIATVVRERADREVELIALSRLRALNLTSEGDINHLQQLLDETPIREKARLNVEGERMLVLCDTNVLIGLALRDLKVSRWLGLEARPGIVERFDGLGVERAAAVVSPAVRSEFLGRVRVPPVRGTAEEEGAILDRAVAIVDRMDLAKVVGGGVTASKEHQERVRRFFSRGEHARRSERLTAAKLRDNPDRAEAIVKGRQGVAEGSARSGRSIAMPERGDQWLLAEAIRLNELPLPGFSSVSILSDDRDFREFASEILREFGVSVLGT